MKPEELEAVILEQAGNSRTDSQAVHNYCAALAQLGLYQASKRTPPVHPPHTPPQGQGQGQRKN